MGSFRKKKAKNMVKMGPRVPRMAVSIEVDIVMAIRKVSWGISRPTTEAAAIFQISPFATLSTGRKKEISQNNAEAPIALIVNSTMGETASALAISLQNTMLRPNIVYVAAIARCPASFSDISD